MRIEKALGQISEIHAHLAKAEVFRGYRALPAAASGALAFLAASLQPKLIPDGAPVSFVVYWTIVAAVSALTAGGSIVYGYVCNSDPAARRRTQTVVGQFLPCVVAGALVTLGIAEVETGAIRFLPGIWAILFSLGLFASRPYLPKMIGWAALYYLVAGAALLGWAGRTAAVSPWEMGLAFGVGQIATGIILYWNLER